MSMTVDSNQQGEKEVARGQLLVIRDESSDSTLSIRRFILRLSREEDFSVLHLNEHIEDHRKETHSAFNGVSENLQLHQPVSRLNF